MRKKLFSLITAALMILTLMPTVSLAKEPAAVAKIGDIPYASLQAAFDACEDGVSTEIDIVKNIDVTDYQVIESCSYNLVVEKNKVVVLDLNGHTVSGAPEESGYRTLLLNKGDLTIKDSSATEKNPVGKGKLVTEAGEYEKPMESDTIQNWGSLTIDAGTIENKTTVNKYICNAISNGDAQILPTNNVVDNISLTINGGYITGTDTAVSLMCVTPASDEQKDADIQNFTMTGGTLAVGSDACEVLYIRLTDDSSSDIKLPVNINISGGSLISEGGYAADFVSSGGLFDAVNMKISGGNIDGIIYSYEDPNGNTANIECSGGCYTSDVCRIVADGCYCIPNQDENTKDDYPFFVTSTLPEGTPVVASVGDEDYYTLDAAVAAAKEGQTVTLRSDTEIVGEEIALDKPITLDLNGKTVTNKSFYGFAIYDEATVKNGTITGKWRSFYVSRIGHLTLADVNATATDMECVMINGGAITSAADSENSLTATGEDCDGIYSRGTVVIDGSGKLEVSGTRAGIESVGEDTYDYDGFYYDLDQYLFVVENYPADITISAENLYASSLVCSIDNYYAERFSEGGAWSIYPSVIPEEKTTSTATVYAGTYGNDVSEYAAKGYVAQKNDDNTWTVIKDPNACRQDDTCVIAKFKDCDPKAWYHDGVHFCLEKGYMVGVKEDRFGPSTALSRAMIVTMLWRMEGSPVVNYAMSFEDVAEDQWYTEAIRWAQSTGIVTGYKDSRFGPKDNVSREQLSAILMRYSEFKGIEVMERADLAAFADVESISSWATDSVQWAVGAGIINGRSATKLAPTGNATRAEAACMLQRVCEAVEK